MNILTVSVSTLLIPIIVVITVAVFFIYKAVYDKHTNQILESGETKKRKWIAPWGLALIVLGAQLILVAGFMFPASMLMFDHTVVELSESNPMHFDLSDSVQFVINESNYDEGTTFTDEGITVTIYSQKRTDEHEYYVILGEIEKQKTDPTYVYVCLGTDNGDFESESYIPVTTDSSKAYFKCEVMTGADKPTSLRVAVDYGDSIDKNSGDLQQDIKLNF
ncbi:MAG: hypothetical protein SPL61_08330 [Saccharofermentans sp.]|nr:hypothetical protein [Saccharofermentans sp.]